MFYTTSDLYTPKEDSKLTTKLNNQLDSINNKMHELKKEWANSYMLANEVSKQAFIHRFVKVPNQQVRESGDGKQDLNSYSTAEELGVPYKVTPKVGQKIDNIFREYVTREFDCEVKSIPNDDWKIITKYLMDESFKSNQFKTALRFGIKDALIKGTGFIRPRLYDLTSDVLSPVISKVGKKRIDFKKVKKTIKQGLEIEYIDCENVYIDPACKNPKELFISNTYSDLELINLYPQVKDYINFTNKVIDNTNRDKYIQPHYISNYKMGERLVEWYKYPEMKLNFNQNGYGGDLNIADSLYADDMGAFNSNWNHGIFGNTLDNNFNQYYQSSTTYNNTYRVNEYYNWADLENPRYVLYVDNIVLYDGPILEPFQDCPIVPLYYERPKESMFGRGIPAVLYNSLINLNEVSTDIAEMTKMAKANMIEVNEDRLVDGNVPIDIEPNGLTIVRTRSGTQDGAIANTPAIIPIQLPISGLEITLQLEQKYKTDIEDSIPNSEPIAINMSKEEREQSIRSRTLIVNEVLNINKIQLNLLAYRVFAMKMFELQYFGEPLGIKTDVSNRLLIVKDTGKQLAETKIEIGKRLVEQYNLQLELVTKQLMQDETFLKQFEQVKAQLQDKYTQLADSTQQDLQDTDMSSEMVTESVVETAKANYNKELADYVNSVASQQVPPPADTSIYLAMEEIDDLISAQKEFKFSFSKSREEQQIAMNQFLSFVGQLPLSGQALSYDTIVAEALVAFDMNPLIKLLDVPPTNQMMSKSQTRNTTFFGLDSSPTNGQALLKEVYGIGLPEDTFTNDMVRLEQLKQSSQVAQNEAKVAAQGKADISREGFKSSLQGGAMVTAN